MAVNRPKAYPVVSETPTSTNGDLNRRLGTGGFSVLLVERRRSDGPLLLVNDDGAAALAANMVTKKLCAKRDGLLSVG